MNEQEYRSLYRQEEHHWWYAGMRAIIASVLSPSLLPPSPRTLDAGCGTGFNLGWLRKQYGGRVTGLDVFCDALSFSRMRGERDLVQGSVAELPFFSHTFDLVISLDVVSHVKGEASRFRSLAEFFRVLKPGGMALIRVAAFEWLRTSHDDEILTHHRYGALELRQAMSESGFQAIRFTFANALLFPAAALWRALKKIGLAPAGSDVRPFTRGPDWFNGTLEAILRLEAAVLRRPSFSFPLGLSLVTLARKPV